MARMLWKVLILCCICGVIEAGVKIEITRVKDPPKPEANSQNAEPQKATESPQHEASITEATTTTTTVPAPKSTTESNVFQITKSEAIATNATAEANATSVPTANTTALTPGSMTNKTLSTANVTNWTNGTSFPNFISPFLYNMTKASGKDISPYLSEFTRREMRRKLIPADYYCPCDLKVNFCDINCCCDVDCASREIMQTLKCSEHDWSIHDYEESSELQLCSHTRHFSLFCVIDNSRKRKQTRKRDYKVHEVNILSVVQYKWPNQFDYKALARSDYREHYIFGDSILVWEKFAEENQYLDIPWSFSASNCRVKSTLKHLVDDEIKCVQTLDDHDQFINDFMMKLKVIKILKYRKPIDTPPLLMMDFCKPAKLANETENCTDTTIYHCLDTISLRTCIEDTNSSSVAEFGENVISDELSIQIHHNFTNILNVSVFFVYHEMSSDAPSHVVQTIRLEYLELNETFATRDVHQVSGNIGYLHHKPVIVTKLIGLNESGAAQPILAYFHNETNCTNDDHYLKLPAMDSNGNCFVNNYMFQTIDFGENSRTKCNVILTLTDMNETSSSLPLNVEQNNTHLCHAFQKQIFDYLLHRFDVNSTIYSQFNVRISELGNPRNDTNYWIEFRSVRPPNLNEIVAIDALNGASEFTCTNMILGLRYEFFYGTTMVGEVSNQALIRVAQIQFGNRVNLKFKPDDDILSVPIYIDVMFYDFSRVVGNSATRSYGSHFVLFGIILVWLFRHQHLH